MSEREARSELRRWCQHSGTHSDPTQFGVCEACFECDECRDAGWKRRLSCYTHTARLRRMLVCSECEQGYFKRAEFDAHECYSAY